MNEPRRMRGDRAATNEVERLLSAGRPTRGMPLDVRGRVASRLGTVAPAAALTFLSWKALAIAAGLGLAGVGSAVMAIAVRERATAGEAAISPQPSARRIERVSRPVPAFAPVRREDVLASPPVVPSPTAPARTVDANVTRAPPAAASAAISAPISSATCDAAPKPVDTLAREVTLLERARADLDADPASTLAVLDEHARAFPDGKLAIERELLAIDALEHLGRDASARAERLLNSARGTIYEGRVRDHLAPRPHFR